MSLMFIVLGLIASGGFVAVFVWMRIFWFDSFGGFHGFWSLPVFVSLFLTLAGCGSVGYGLWLRGDEVKALIHYFMEIMA